MSGVISRGDMDNSRSQGNGGGEERSTRQESAAAAADSRALVVSVDGESMRAMFEASSPLAAQILAEYNQNNLLFHRFGSNSPSPVVMNSRRRRRPVVFEGPPGFPVRYGVPTDFPVVTPPSAANPAVVTPSPAPSSPPPAATQPGQKRAVPDEVTTQETEIAGGQGADFSLLEVNVVYVEPGEDLLSKIIDFCVSNLECTSPWSSVSVISAVGAVSRATLRRNNPTSHPYGGFETFEGWHEIMSLGGSYDKLLQEISGGELERSIAGGLNITLAKGDGRVIAGPVGGPLIAASKIQVVLAGSSGDDDGNAGESGE